MSSYHHESSKYSRLKLISYNLLKIYRKSSEINWEVVRWYYIVNGQERIVNVGNQRERTIVKLELKPRGEEENEEFINNYTSDTESIANSPNSHSSSILGSNDSGIKFSASSSRISSNSSRGHCGLGSMSGEDEERDWEAFADAWTANEEKQEAENGILDSRVNNHPLSGVDVLQKNQENNVNIQRNSVSNCRAWRPGDSSRPQSLPNLEKHFSFPMNTDQHFGIGNKSWNCNTTSELTSYPICTKDFDVTDTSFCPCLYGYRLCLFCYKKILEYNDARCPGCMKQYDCVPLNQETTL